VKDRTVGRVVRALRHRKRLTQWQLGEACGVSQGTISNLEGGHIDRMSVRAVRAALSRLDADLSLQVFWRYGVVDLLLDERHLVLVGVTSNILRRHGWDVVPEISYSEYGERGSIDLVALQTARRVLLIVEVKTELVSIEATLRKLDEKVRLGPTIVRDRFGWQLALVGRVLVLPEESTARRRVARHEAVLDQALPQRGRAFISWLRSPVRPLAAIWFASPTTGRDHKRRVVTRSVIGRGEIGQSDA
jgi:transcriptional regulator with XRE-family HTH domain